MMNLQFLFLITICLVAECSSENAKKFGKHSFPLKGPKGIELANEYQLLEVENFRDERQRGATSESYSIDDVSPLLISNDEIVTIRYSSSKPVTSDWIGAYSPADADITQTVPIKYGWCDDSATYISNGYGSLTFNLTNLRADVGFYYFTGGLSKGVLVAKFAKSVTFKNINEPLRARVVPTGDYDEFKLVWSSASSVKPTLRWGTESGVLDRVVDAVTTTVSRSDLCGSPANSTGFRDLGLIHTASLKGMKALSASKIYYRFGDEATNDYSEEVVFFTPPLPGAQPPSRPTTAVLFDDLGRGSTDTSYTWNEYGRPSIFTAMSVGAEVAAGTIDVIYHGGDISYATGYLAVWDFYLDMISPMARSALYLTTVGNHESDWYNSASYFSNADSGGECGVAATSLIPMPAPATLNQPWWSYNVGLLHFVGMSTEHDFHEGSKQYQFLEEDLKAVDRSVTPWVIFGAHRAMYLNSNYGSDSAEASDIGFMDMMIPIIEPLMYKYKVNMAFYGHNHVVQRHSAVLNKKVIQKSVAVTNSDGTITNVQTDPQATVHLVIGTGGATFTKNSVNPYPDWNENVYYEYGYSRLTAVNATYLDWKWILGTSGEVLDHLVITQANPAQGFA